MKNLNQMPIKLIAIIFSLLFSIKVSAMEFTNGFALETKDGVLAGFMLGSPSFKVDAGNCVFMLLPGSVVVVETSLGIAISELKAIGENSWNKENNGIVVQVDGNAFLTIDSSGNVLDAKGNDIGMAKPLPENK